MEKDCRKSVCRWLSLWAFVLFFIALPTYVQAGSSLSVRYDRAQDGYYLCRGTEKKDAGKVTEPGLYQIGGEKVKGRVFDGIYYVSQEGRIHTNAGIRYIPKTKRIGKTRYHRGYFHFDEGGKLSTKSGLVYRKNTKIHGYTFRGYYYYTAIGRIYSGSMGLVYLDCRINGRTFKGYYYREEMSRICQGNTIRQITQKDGANKKFPGYRYLKKGGRLDTAQGTHKLDLTYKGVRYKGHYCFAGKDGRMVRKKGLVNVGDIYYYVADKNGKCLTRAKKKVQGFSYAFGADGTGRRTSTKLGGLTSKLNAQIRGYNGTWSVYVKRLDNNDSLTINDQPLYAASVIKAYVMASLYDQIKKGDVQETDTIRSLLNAMITVSSNEAFNELVMRQTASHGFLTGCGVINRYLAENGYTKTGIHTAYAGLGISDGGINYTGVKDCGKLLESIYRGTCVDKECSQKMLDLLKAQKRRAKIPAGVPSGITVANKTGETSTSDHDIAIVYGPKCTYIICVMSLNSYNSTSRVAQISRTVYDHLE